MLGKADQCTGTVIFVSSGCAVLELPTSYKLMYTVDTYSS